MRLDKFLVDCGLGSRRQVKEALKQKLVRVNEEVVTSPKQQVDEKTDRISFKGILLEYERFVYYLLNKPKGLLSATEDKRQRTVLDILDDKARQKAVFPVGRLDKDTTGLLLLTNNGQLAHAMLAPKKHVDKVYQAEVAGIMTERDRESFAQGLELKDHVCQPAVLEILKTDEGQASSQVRITIREGKFHQVKRMVRACGKEVKELKRLSMGPLELPADLAEGDSRPLSTEEVASLEIFGVDL